MRTIRRAPYGTRQIAVVGPRGGVVYRDVPCWAPTSQGKQLRERRKQLRLTLRKAAKQVGMTMAELSQVERGERVFVDATWFGEVLMQLERGRDEGR